jgi:hypothetical protein
MGERGMSSQISVVCNSHGWLEVEEERECSPWEEKEEVKVGKLSLYMRTLAHATLVKREKKRKRLCMHNSCKEGRSFSMQRVHCPWSCWLFAMCNCL